MFRDIGAGLRNVRRAICRRAKTKWPRRARRSCVRCHRQALGANAVIGANVDTRPLPR
ncbi:MAG: hypothetical protein ACLVKA_03690 [Collinsella aerofaciens]